MVVAELVVALQVQLIVDVIALLQIAKGAAEGSLLKLDRDHGNFLAHISKRTWVSRFDATHDLVHDLFDNNLTGVDITQMRSDRVLGELLNEDVDDSVEDAWRQEELHHLSSVGMRLDVIIEIKAQVLHDSGVGVIVKEKVLLDLR